MTFIEILVTALQKSAFEKIGFMEHPYRPSWRKPSGWCSWGDRLTKLRKPAAKPKLNLEAAFKISGWRMMTKKDEFFCFRSGWETRSLERVSCDPWTFSFTVILWMPVMKFYFRWILICTLSWRAPRILSLMKTSLVFMTIVSRLKLSLCAEWTLSGRIIANSSEIFTLKFSCS